MALNLNKLRLAAPIERYHSISIILHWLIAIAVVFMFTSGLYMVNADISKAQQYNLFQIHKGAGVLVLLSVTMRVLMRLFLKAPALPDKLNSTEKRYALGGHVALYIGMICMPLSGWLMVSASPFGLPTIVFDMFEWPHIPGVSRNKSVETLARNVHWYLGLSFLLMLVIHIAAVIKHKRKDNINLLNRMWWR